MQFRSWNRWSFGLRGADKSTRISRKTVGHGNISGNRVESIHSFHLKTKKAPALTASAFTDARSFMKPTLDGRSHWRASSAEETNNEAQDKEHQEYEE